MVARQNVIWLGAAPPAHAMERASILRLSISLDANTGVAQIDNAFAQARALVLNVSGPADPLLEKGRARILAIARRHGLIGIAISPREHVRAVRDAFGSERWRQPEVFTADNLGSVLDQILDHEAGPSWRSGVNFPDAAFKALDDEDKLLLRRAFHDCKEVRMRSIGGNAKVFQVFATLNDSRAGSYPLPFFVKLDRCPKISREMKNYRDFTSSFVPFYARPNLDESRCMLGWERGIIVGNFVEHSSSLAELVHQGAAHTAINSLFDDALRGWRRQTVLPSSRPANQNLAQSLGGAARQDKWDNAEQRAKAAVKFGSKLTPQALAAKLEALPSQLHLRAIAHGDLHAENVRVRHGQAILIDFAAVEEGPLVADPAALETALCLTALCESEAGWRECVGELYDPKYLVRLPPTRAPGSDLSHLCDAVRQVRRFGLAEAMSEGEYAAAVAVFLFRHSFRKALDNEHPDRRPYLYWLAERITDTL